MDLKVLKNGPFHSVLLYIDLLCNYRLCNGKMWHPFECGSSVLTARYVRKLA